MNGYSYSEIQNMQQKAMARVREMKRTSDELTRVAQKEFDYHSKNADYTSNSSPVTARVTNMPPNFPENKAYPTFKDYFANQQEEISQKTMKQEHKPKENVLQNLFSEPDKALLLGLIMLLKSENADESLIMALTYIMS